MSYDKLVDSAKLDADLHSVADAIREKARTSEEMVFPDGFVKTIQAISSNASGFIYDMGEFILDADTVSGKNISVPHSLGIIPEFICVWTDHWTDLTSDTPISYDDAKQTAVGFVWFDMITGMTFRATSVNNGVPLCTSLYINNGDYRLGAGLPTSGSYGIFDEFLSENTFSPPTFGVNGARYRAGVTYKYFISKAWWNIGGEVNA